jgi:ABC-type sugar transport system ATPase subunit
MDKILEIRNISKTYPGVKALDDVSLDLEKGEILALLGENGAGKSTIVKILAGAIQPDCGEIILDGRPIKCDAPHEMMEKGIAVMYQELNYFNDLSIAENVFVGNLPVNALGRVNFRELKMKTGELLGMVGLDRDPMTEVSALSVAEKQMIEIAKVLSRKSRVLLLDEPTAALNDCEIETLFKLLRELSAKGISIIYISHRMEEIFALSDRVHVLRDGKTIGVRRTSETDVNTLVSMMVGRTIDNMYPKKELPIGDVVLDVSGLNGAKVRDVSLEVRAGEVVGLFGLMGSGRTEIAETIFGKREKTSGTIKVDGKAVDIRGPRDAISSGIAYVPRERKADGLVLVASVKHNLSLAFLDRLTSFIGLKLGLEKKLAREWVHALKIKTPGIDTVIGSLSGGNQQKVVIGKWLQAGSKVLLLNEPTRGVDVGAKVEMYNLIEELCSKGMAIVMISSETPEIMGISDRIIVIHEGRVWGEIKREDFDQEKIMHLAIGGTASC